MAGKFSVLILVKSAGLGRVAINRSHGTTSLQTWRSICGVLNELASRSKTGNASTAFNLPNAHAAWEAENTLLLLKAFIKPRTIAWRYCGNQRLNCFKAPSSLSRSKTLLKSSTNSPSPNLRSASAATCLTKVTHSLLLPQSTQHFFFIR